MWTLFLIIALNANPSDITGVLIDKSIMGGISSHEIGFFRNQGDCLMEVIALREMSDKLLGPSDYVVDYICFPTISEPEEIGD